MSHLSNNIRIIRALTRKTQTQFAALFGENITEAMQKSYEGGKARPGILYMETLSEMSGVPMKHFYDRILSRSEILDNVERFLAEKVKKVEPEIEEDVVVRDTPLPGTITIQDHIATLTRWREDIEAKYQDSNKRELALIEALKSIGANLSQGQHELKEQIFASGDHLAQLLTGLRADFAGAFSKKGKGGGAQKENIDGKGKAG